MASVLLVNLILGPNDAIIFVDIEKFAVQVRQESGKKGCVLHGFSLKFYDKPNGRNPGRYCHACPGRSSI